MINDNEDPTEMEYELKGTAAFELGTTSDSNPSKKKKKIKTAKARGPTFSRFEDILLVKAWLATAMDPICGTEQKGNKYWEKIWKEYHEQKEYVEPHAIVTPAIWHISSIRASTAVRPKSVGGLLGTDRL